MTGQRRGETTLVISISASVQTSFNGRDRDAAGIVATGPGPLRRKYISYVCVMIIVANRPSKVGYSLPSSFFNRILFLGTLSPYRK